jgi:hypothetical protein
LFRCNKSRIITLDKGEHMSTMTRNLLTLAVVSAILTGCGGGGGTPTPSYDTSIAQPSLPGTVVKILQNTGAGLIPIPANPDGSYNITDQTAIVVNAQTTQGLPQSLNWGLAAIDSSNLNYAALTTGGYKIAGSTDPILQQIGYSGLATVPSTVSNPTSNAPLELQSLIAPGGTLILGLSQGLTLASAPFQTNINFRVISAYAGNWSVSYGVGGQNPLYTGSCNISISNRGIVSGSCNDPFLGTYAVTGRDYGAGNAMGVQFQGQNGIVNFFLGSSPVASNLLQGKTNLFVTASSTSATGTGGSSSNSVTSISAQDPIACKLVPGATFVQNAANATCTNSVLFGNTTGQNSNAFPVTWTATKVS